LERSDVDKAVDQVLLKGDFQVFAFLGRGGEDLGARRRGTLAPSCRAPLWLPPPPYGPVGAI